MSNTQHRLGVCEMHLVVRHLKLAPGDDEAINAAIDEIDQQFGLDGVSFDPESRIITLAYDATRLGLEDIEAILATHQVEIGHGWWTHMKQSFYEYVDQNMKENAAQQPWSCHQNPPASPKR